MMMKLMMMGDVSVCCSLLFQIVRTDVVLALDIVQFVLFLVNVHTFEGLIRLIIQYDQIPIANIETGQMIAGVLGIEDVLVDDESRSARLRRISAAIIRKQRTIIQSD